ncbi:Glutamate receptor 3.3 [Camellia lanceoleosa]|uniref:Glutamate receptor 3.3 n=1 Tax=Camellia lanceoleosa TaxID=1840588 RepID=A0ACC0HEB1_9ERIC|nr:Glutamate receptor 3.3 [Camellia lanceoleosa]
MMLNFPTQPFHRDSPLVVDLSTTIPWLSENGDLQRIHNRWILLDRCSTYNPEDEEQDIDEPESARPKSTSRMTNFKDSFDKKEDEVMESIKRKSDNKRQASQHFDRQPNSSSK